jgi:hypothetical protein
MGRYYLLKFNLSEFGSDAMYKLSQYPNEYSFSDYKVLFKKYNLWIVYSDIDNIDNINVPKGVSVKNTPINFSLKIPSFIQFNKEYYELLIKIIFDI